MSGGSYNRLFEKVLEMADALLEGVDLEGDPTPLTPKLREARTSFARYLRRVAEAMQRIEMVDSYDESPGDELDAINAALAGVRRRIAGAGYHVEMSIHGGPKDQVHVLTEQWAQGLLDVGRHGTFVELSLEQMARKMGRTFVERELGPRDPRVFLVYCNGGLLASSKHEPPTVPPGHPEVMVCHQWEEAHLLLTEAREAGRVEGGCVIMGESIDDAWARRDEVPF